MRIKLTTVVATAVLALGLTAGPAAAQEGFPPGTCPPLSEDGAVVLEEDGEPLTQEEATYLLEESGLTIDEICTIYGVEVLVELEEDPEDPEDPEGTGDPEDPVASPEGEPTQPTEVLGVQLARTGVDVGVIALVGAAVLGLGFFALRRSRRPNES